jgi:ketosteroid isomerase-like protein
MDPQYTARFLDALRRPEAIDGNYATLLATYEAVIRGDFEALGAYFTDDVELDVRGIGTMDGNWRGRKPVVEAARANFGQLSSQKPEIESMISQGDSIAVLFHESGVFKLDGSDYRFRVVQWFTFADGKVKRIDEVIAKHPL